MYIFLRKIILHICAYVVYVKLQVFNDYVTVTLLFFVFCFYKRSFVLQFLSLRLILHFRTFDVWFLRLLFMLKRKMSFKLRTKGKIIEKSSKNHVVQLKF